MRTHTHAHTLARSHHHPERAMYLALVVLDVDGLLAWGARPRRVKRMLRDGLQEMFTIETSDDSGSKLRDKEQQRLSSK